MYDLAVIGAGWAGFNAALKAKQLGQKVCLIEKDELGGTCLNRGCIPTKTLIQSARVFQSALKSAHFGIELENPRINFEKIQERKDKIVALLRQGMQSRLQEVDFIRSSAGFISDNQIKTEAGKIEAKFILIATGSRPMSLAGLKFDKERVISSDEALTLKEIPKTLLVVGGGFIGCEFASLFSILGSSVTITEKFSSLLPGHDAEISRKLQSAFAKKGIKVVTGEETQEISFNDYSKVLVCVGRTPNTEELGLESLGVKCENNRILTNECLRTNIDNIYAAGDCASKTMLAHYAAYQGSSAVEAAFSGDEKKADNQVIPACLFTDPQISFVGLSEEDAGRFGIRVKTHKFDFRASATARIMDEPEGFIKIVSSLESQEVLGAGIIGPLAAELISIALMAVSFKLKVEQLRSIIFAHPTLSENMQEALKS